MWSVRPEFVSVGLASTAVAIAAYLTLVHYRGSLLVCSGVSDCETVQSSRYSEIAGMPVALAGLLVMTVVLALGIIRLVRVKVDFRLTLAIVSLVAASLMFYVYLTWLELFVIDAICQWCVVSFAIAVALFVSELVLLRELFDASES